jgi:hypothetical protein
MEILLLSQLCFRVKKSNILDCTTIKIRLSDWSFFLLSDYRNIDYRTIQLGKLLDYLHSEQESNYRTIVYRNREKTTDVQLCKKPKVY